MGWSCNAIAAFPQRRRLALRRDVWAWMRGGNLAASRPLRTPVAAYEARTPWSRASPPCPAGGAGACTPASRSIRARAATVCSWWGRPSTPSRPCRADPRAWRPECRRPAGTAPVPASIRHADAARHPPSGGQRARAVAPAVLVSPTGGVGTTSHPVLTWILPPGGAASCASP